MAKAAKPAHGDHSAQPEQAHPGVWLAAPRLADGGLGVAAYYGLEVGDRLLMERLGGAYQADGPLPIVEVDETVAPQRVRPRSAPGNRWMNAAVAALERHQSIVAGVNQFGWVENQPIEASGKYYQLGSGDARRFELRVEGRLGDAQARLRRVSDSRFLWTDLAWKLATDEPSRSVKRLDLRRVRRAMRPTDETETPAATTMDWARLGGLPMLLAGLDTSFDFALGRRMQLRGEEVIAMVGYWRDDRIAELAPDAGSLPVGFADHVVVALSRATLFPLLVEYRSADDPLARPDLPDEARLRPSRRPLMKIDFVDPRFGERLVAEAFRFDPRDAAWQDETDRELALLKRREERVASAGGSLTADERRR